MLSNVFVQKVCRFRSRASLYHKAYSTTINVKHEPITNDNSFVERINQEWRTSKPFKALPGLTKFQLVRGFMRGGDFHDKPFDELVLTCRQRYGDTFLLPGLFGRPATVISFNVEDFEKVHRTEGIWPVRPVADALMYYRKNRPDGFFNDWEGLMATGEKWAKFRHAVNPVLMQPRNAKLYLDPMQNVNEEFLQRIRDIRDSTTMEVPHNFLDDINHLTFESVAVVALDKQLGLIRNNPDSAEAALLFDSLKEFMKSLYDLDIKPSLYKYLPTPGYRRFKNSMNIIFDTIGKYVNEALVRIESQPSNIEGKSVLENLAKIDKKIAIIMAMDMLMAGVDTTSTILSGILLCIAKNPEKQEKLRKELLTILPNKGDRFTIENMVNLPYLRACIKESMRIYPIIFGNARETGMDITMSGYRIPKGTRVMMNSNMLLMEERYFPKPKEFIPERWLRTNVGNEKLMAENLNPFIYLPFGFGPRTCVGKRIVDMELEMTLGNLVRNFNIEFNYPTENAFRYYFLNTPVIPLKFKFSDLK